MKNERDSLTDIVKDAASGYGATILGVVCFLLALAVIMAVVRFIVGMGAGTGV